MVEEADVVIVGGGLAGLGAAFQLASKHGKRVVVLEATTPKLDGNDRFDPAIAASFKNGGMLDFGAVSVASGKGGVREYCAKRTIAQYEALGVTVRREGVFTLAGKRINALLTDVALERHLPEDFAKSEPNVKLASSSVSTFKFPRGAQAEPEHTMCTIIGKIKELPGVSLLFGHNVTSMKFDAGAWHIEASSSLASKSFKGRHLILAAGPATRRMMRKHLRLNIETETVIGVQTQSAQLTEPWLQGSILGAQSAVDWGCYKYCGCCRPRPNIYTTSMLGDSHRWTTHLYVNSYNQRIYIGGPRIQLPNPDSFTETMLDPSKYEVKMQASVDYLKTLVDLPTKEPVEKAWAGFMSFPADKEFPLVGPVQGIYEDSLYLNTGHGSAGFREAFGAGNLLADMLVEGLAPLDQITEDDFNVNWKQVLPTLGERVRKI